MSETIDTNVASLLNCFAQGAVSEEPYRHWNLSDCIPNDTMDEIITLPIDAPVLDGESGRRELHNATRTYFDHDNREKYSCCEVLAQALQDKRVTSSIESTFGVNLDGTYLRIEYVQDTGGFWLEPHTDLGVKSFTMLLYASKNPSHSDLGTDIYNSAKEHVSRSPFQSNGALVFVPADDTFHGFERRDISGIRQSIIINYVTNDWRERDQLAFPDAPISSGN